MLEGKSKESRFQLRLELVRYARREGLREAARVFRCSRNTVRLWVRRYEVEGFSGLQGRSRAPHRIPHKTSLYLENKVVEARRQVPCYGAFRLKQMFGLRPSVGAIGRILRERGLTRRPKRRYQKKRDLRQVKARYQALSYYQVDVKHLYDIAHYWPYMRRLGLPRYQYTIRDVKSGSLVVSFAGSLSVSSAAMVVERYCWHLRAHGVDVGGVVFQTDCGAEFSGNRRKRVDRGFTYTVEELWGAKHTFIPPGCCNANADVESSHGLIEQEFYDVEPFGSRGDFLRKATVYQDYFNFVRPNSYKGGRSPWEIVKEDRPGISPWVLKLPPVFLDQEFNRSYLLDQNQQVGHHVPVDPDSAHFFP